MINKKSIQDLIINGKLKKAAKDFMALAKDKDDDLHNTLILQMSRINALEREVNMGIIAQANANMNQNRIAHALLSLLDDVEDNWIANDTSTGTVAATPPIPKNDSDVKTILFLGVNPKGTQKLKIDEEVRNIETGLRLSQHRDKFKLITKLAVRVEDLRRYLLDESPHIVHFSGHGEGDEGLVFENGDGNQQLVDGDAIAQLFSLFADSIECVLLNACYSTTQAESIVKFIPNVIGMNRAMPDDAAIKFSVAFYDALGAGRDIDFAYKLGRNAIMMQGISGSNIPQLLKN